MTDLRNREPRRSDNVVVGHFSARHDIIVYREPEVGIAWEAEASGMGLSALGKSPQEAAANLIRAINERGISGQGSTDTKIVDEWRPDDE